MRERPDGVERACMARPEPYGGRCRTVRPILSRNSTSGPSFAGAGLPTLVALLAQALVAELAALRFRASFYVARGIAVEARFG